MYRDDIKLFANIEKELETLIQTVNIYSQHTGIEFDIEKCTNLVIKMDKRHITEGVELPNQLIIKTLEEKETYKILGDTKRWHHQASRNKRKKNWKSISKDTRDHSWSGTAKNSNRWTR